MRRVESHLVADVDLEHVRSALADWGWLIGNEWSPILLSAVGDAFLVNSSGRIARLDTGSGKLELIARSLREFEGAWVKPSVLDEWFLTPVVEALRTAGKTLGPNECYGFTVLPIFAEGSYAADNRFVLNALEHIRFTADMHRQLKDVKDGELVEIKVV